MAQLKDRRCGQGWGAQLIAEMHARGDHRGCGAPSLCVGPQEGVTERAAERSPRYRSKTEARYALRLAELERRREISNWVYEPITLTIGSGLGGRGARYTPDFAVTEYGTTVLQLHEVKGGLVREAARVRFLSAARQYPCFRWFWCVWRGGQWTIEEVSP